MEVPWGELSFGANSQLGAGAQGTVRKGRHKGTEYAVKIFKPDELRDFKEEVRVLEHLRHPNIVAFYGAVTRDSAHHAIIQELCTGSVYDYLQKFGSAVKFPSTTGVLELPLAQRIKWAHDAAKGMIFLHSRKVRHSRHLASTHRVLRLSWSVVAHRSSTAISSPRTCSWPTTPTRGRPSRSATSPCPASPPSGASRAAAAAVATCSRLLTRMRPAPARQASSVPRR